MTSFMASIIVQTATPEPGTEIGELVEVWSPLVRFGWFLVGCTIVYLLGRYVVEPTIARSIRRRNQDNPTIQEAISRYVRLVVVVVAVFVGAGVAGYGRFLSNSALVVAAGTLAIGVAGQTVIGSIVSGLALVVDPDFNIGDYIKWPDGEGEVRSITLRVTRVHTPGGELVTIPNTTLTSETVSRPYGRERHRIVEHIGIAYGDDIDRALDHLREAATERSGVLTDPPPSAYVDEFGGDAVVVRVQYWIENPRSRDVLGLRSAYARDVKGRLDREEITISPASQRELQGRIEIEDSRSVPP